VLRLLHRLQRGIETAGDVMADVAGWIYLLSAFFITFDVVSRRYLGFSSQGTTEITGYLLASAISWGLAHALSCRAHIRVDVLLTRFRVRVRAYLHTVALALLTVMALLFARRAWSVIAESWEFGARDTSALSLPLTVPQVPWAFGLTVFAALTVVMLLRACGLLVAGRPEAVDRMVASRGFEEEAEEAREAAGLAAPPPPGRDERAPSRDRRDPPPASP
jgi:TRAP-type C4-dicarboxylate transport system permease small subunit